MRGPHSPRDGWPGRRRPGSRICRVGVNPGRGRRAPNKPSPGRGGLGIDYGLRTIDDLETRTPGAAMRQTNPIGGLRLSARRGPVCQTNPIWPGGAGKSEACSSLDQESETRNPRQARMIAMTATSVRQTNPIRPGQASPGGEGRSRQTNPMSTVPPWRHPMAPNKPNWQRAKLRKCG